MTAETGIDTYRDAFSFMAVIAAVSVRRVQDIADKGRSIAAVGAVTGGAVLNFLRKVWMLLLHRLESMTNLA